jgi:alanyl-tRNA synthetase
VSESGIAAGIRRVEAITGDSAFNYFQELEAILHGMAAQLKIATAQVPSRLTQTLDQVKLLEREIVQLKGQIAQAKGNDLMGQVVQVGSVKVLAARLDNTDAKTLRETVDNLKNKLGTAVVVLAAVEGSKIQLVAGITANTTNVVKAGELVNFVAQQVGGKGGGKPDMAMAGGNDPTRLADALRSVLAWVTQRVS